MHTKNLTWRITKAISCAFVLFAFTHMGSAFATPPPACVRYAPGSPIPQAQDLYSQHGVLNVSLSYNISGPDADGILHYCFTTPQNDEAPTLHVWPGDTLIVTLTNNVPSDITQDYDIPPGTNNPASIGMDVSNPCFDTTMYYSSVNLHFHGLNIAPTCGQDDILHTVINSGHTYTYTVQIPNNEPPGLYWYHPHIHGTVEGVLQGGASGAIVVEGIQNVQPAVAGLPEQTLVIRDQPVPGNPTPTIGTEIPSWDVSLNYVLVSSCQQVQPCDPSQFVGDFKPGVIQMKPNEKQLWRIVNSAAHTLIVLQVNYDGKPQPLTIVGEDGVPVGSGDGTWQGKTFTETSIMLPTAGRVEFIVTGPSASVKKATLETLQLYTGPDGDNDPTRPLATIVANANAPEPPVTIGGITAPPSPPRFADLFLTKPTGYRTLYFSEVLADPDNPLGPTNFFITPDGQTPTLFSPSNAPAIITQQGAVEDWTIENRALENHEFHIHQIHFLLVAVNGRPVPPDQRQYLDMINIPYWKGIGPYPSVTLRMDFRGADVGDFVYHCHITFHEDFGMMGIIRILPSI